MNIREFQDQIEAIYLKKDTERGVEGTTMWFFEEIGELVRALRRNDRENLEEEFADVLAWLASLASIRGVDLEQAACKKYEHGCPRCRATPCSC